MNQADRRPRRLVRTIGGQRRHPVVLLPFRGLKAARRQILEPMLPLGAAIGAQALLVDDDHHHARPEDERDPGPQAFPQEGPGQRAAQPSRGQRQADGRPLDGRAAGLGQRGDDLGDRQPSRGIQGNLDPAFGCEAGSADHGKERQGLAGEKGGEGHGVSITANSGP